MTFESSADVRVAAVKGLTSISKIHPAIIEATTLPPLFHALPDRAPSISQEKARDTYRSVLHSLSQLCALPALFETLVIRVLTKLDLLSTPSPTPTDSPDDPMDAQPGLDQRECSVAYAWDLIHCLAGVVDTKLEEKHVDVVKHFDTVVPRLFALCIESASVKRSKNRSPLFSDRRLLVVIGRLVTRLAWELSAE